MKVLLSIKPEYVERIISGEKQFEYRKSIFKEEVDSVVIYSTLPVGKIIGEFTIEEVISDTPNKLWNRTHRYSGVSKEFFMGYFNGREKGFALKIKEFIEYSEPIDPKTLNESFTAPQSYRYINDNFLLV